MLNVEVEFSGVVKSWHGGKSTWYYVSLPAQTSDEIAFLAKHHQAKRRGWGAVKVDARIGDASWQTSIFPAFENHNYQLFLKAEVRKKASITVGSSVQVSLMVAF